MDQEIQRWVDRLWEAEFRGFFWGEGCITVHYYKRRRGERVDVMFRPVIKVAVREDDGGILRECQRRLGGHLFRRNPYVHKDGNSRPGSLTWDVVNASELRNIVRILLDGQLPSKKKAEAELFATFLDFAHKQGKKYTPEEKAYAAEVIEELRRLKRFAPHQDDQVISA